MTNPVPGDKYLHIGSQRTWTVVGKASHPAYILMERDDDGAAVETMRLNLENGSYKILQQTRQEELF